MQSQESPSALGGPTAAEQHLPLHAAHLVVIVPRQLRAGPNPPARVTNTLHLNLSVVTLVSRAFPEHFNPNLNITVSGLCLWMHKTRMDAKL